MFHKAQKVLYNFDVQPKTQFLEFENPVARLNVATVLMLSGLRSLQFYVFGLGANFKPFESYRARSQQSKISLVLECEQGYSDPIGIQLNVVKCRSNPVECKGRDLTDTEIDSQKASYDEARRTSDLAKVFGFTL